MHGVTGAVGDHFAENLLAQQREISDQVENLVAHEFVGETERAVLDAVAREHDAVFPRRSANQSHVAHGLLVLARAEGAGGGNVLQVAAVGKFYLEGFFADERVREVDGVRNRIRVAGINRNKFVPLAHFQLAANLQIFARAPLLAYASLANHVDKRLGAAVEDGQFQVVELDDGVVDAQADERREQVLGSRNQHAFFHQAGGIADAGHIAADGLDLKAVEISAPEDDAGARRSGYKAHGNRSATVKAHAGALHRRADCLLL